MNSPTQAGPDMRNLIVAIVLATGIMLGWQYFYERPHRAAQAVHAAAVAQTSAPAKAMTPDAPTETSTALAASSGPRITISSPALHGSIPLTGARFDELTLAQYRETTAPDSPEVKLLNRSGTDAAYFAEIGVLPGNDAVRVPDSSTEWKADGQELAPGKPVTLTWNNGAGLTFTKKIEMDEHYMFTVTTTVKNTGSSAATLYPYGLISQNHSDVSSSHFSLAHEGPLGVTNNMLEDVTYKDLRKETEAQEQRTKDKLPPIPSAFAHSDVHGWIGMTDKYWFTALIPDSSMAFDTAVTHFKRGGHDAYQTNLRAGALDVPAGGTASFTMHLFAGAKVVQQLDAYSTQYNIPLFDRAVDFGSLYFITKPIFGLLNWFHGKVGNFGIAILLLTVVIKLILFPLAHKSMTAMARTKQLMPQMQEIRERYASDKMKMNQEVMALYKREKVNPVGGCLPLLLQIPIFISLYRVLSVTIEMRQAPFFGWIHDLSVPDPANLFTAFGYLPWDAPSFLHLGVWPLVMCVTMVIQQRLNPKPADEVQAMMMNYMPFMFTFMFAGLPAGVVIYYAWNNTLTIFQMMYINAHLTKKGLR